MVSSPAKSRRGRCAPKGRFGEAEPEGCASIREDAEEMVVVFCCFSEREANVYDKMLKG